MSENQGARLAKDSEAVKAVYASLNQDNIPGVLKYFDPLIERVEPDGFPASGTYRGLKEVEDHFKKGRGTWAEGGCEPERLIVYGDRVIALVHVRVRLKNSTEWLEGRLADVFTFRDGKVIQMRTFADKREALEWVGVDPSEGD